MKTIVAAISPDILLSKLCIFRYFYSSSELELESSSSWFSPSSADGDDGGAGGEASSNAGPGREVGKIASSITSLPAFPVALATRIV